jgi:BspA type Leucine rich repeat region (6 copies)/Immunoglobulin domain
VYCRNLTRITMPDSVTNIGWNAFSYCTGLTNITIADSVTSIEMWAFSYCTGLTNVTIGSGVTSIGDYAFWGCTDLSGACFGGNAPSLLGPDVFSFDDNATVYYLPGTSGWGTTFGGRPTALWWIPPSIQVSPLTRTAEAGSEVGLRAEASGPLPLFYLWYFNHTNLIGCGTNDWVTLSNVQFSQSGIYTVTVTNVAGAVTSSPALLNVIAPVERRPVPGVKVTGAAGSRLNLDSAQSVSSGPNWDTLASVSLTTTSQYYFDLTLPLPPQRLYRAWQTGAPSVIPSVDLHLVPAITLTGSIGSLVRVDGINRLGPIDAWVTLDTVALTNTSQLYFDVSAPGQAERLYRLVPLP